MLLRISIALYKIFIEMLEKKVKKVDYMKCSKYFTPNSQKDRRRININIFIFYIS